MTIDYLRTDDARFENLPDFPWKPAYVDVGGLRMAYLDEGPREAAPVLLLHGEPSWSFLYRKMIPTLLGAGHRVIAPDLIGFGRSDKPKRREDYTYARHLEWTGRLVDALELRDITLFGQDWGGLIGLRLATATPDRFARIVVANTFLPTGKAPPNEAFKQWQSYSQRVPVLPVSGIIQGATCTDLDASELAAYDAPFPHETYKEGARQFPTLVPTSLDDPEAAPNAAAWDVLRAWDKPFLTLFGDSDPIMSGLDAIFHKHVPGCAGQPHAVLKDAHHFLQEDVGQELAAAVNEFIGATGS